MLRAVSYTHLDVYKRQVKCIVRAVHLAAVMNKIGHLDVEQQRLIGILHIEGVKTSACLLYTSANAVRSCHPSTGP